MYGCITLLTTGTLDEIVLALAHLASFRKDIGEI